LRVVVVLRGFLSSQQVELLREFDQLNTETPAHIPSMLMYGRQSIMNANLLSAGQHWSATPLGKPAHSHLNGVVCELLPGTAFRTKGRGAVAVSWSRRQATTRLCCVCKSPRPRGRRGARGAARPRVAAGKRRGMPMNRSGRTSSRKSKGSS